MSKYSELAEMLDGAANGSPDGADAELFNEAAEALRELEAENKLYEDALANYEEENATLRARIAELEAARIAYAREFPLNEEGEPDVGSIHQNIRTLKAERDSLREALLDYMSQFGQALEANAIPFSPAQQAADAKARAALEGEG